MGERASDRPVIAIACLGYVLLQTTWQNRTPFKEVHSSRPDLFIKVKRAPFILSKFLDDLRQLDFHWSAERGVVWFKRSHSQRIVLYNYTISECQDSIALGNFFSAIQLRVIYSVKCWSSFVSRSQILYISFPRPMLPQAQRWACGDELFSFWRRAYFQSLFVLVSRSMFAFPRLELSVISVSISIAPRTVVESKAFWKTFWWTVKGGFLQLPKTELVSIYGRGPLSMLARQWIRFSHCCRQLLNSWLSGSLWGCVGAKAFGLRRCVCRIWSRGSLVLSSSDIDAVMYSFRIVSLHPDERSVFEVSWELQTTVCLGLPFHASSDSCAAYTKLIRLWSVKDW